MMDEATAASRSELARTYRTSPCPVPEWVVLAVTLIVACQVSSRNAQASPTSDIGLVGNDAILWAYQVRPGADDGERLLRFAYRRAGRETFGRFRALPMASVTGRVALAAARGQFLHVLFADGTHRRYMPPRRRRHVALPPLVQVVEVKLPDSALPSALAADEPGGIIYAIVTGRQAAKIEAFRAAAEELLQTDEEPPASEPEEEGRFTGPYADRVVARYESGNWYTDRNGPSDLALDAEVLALLVADAAVHIVYAVDAEGSAYVDRISSGAGEPWSEPVALPLNRRPAISAAGWAGSRPVILVTDASEKGVTIYPVKWDGEAWREGSELVNEEGRPVVFPDPERGLSMTLFESEVAVAAVDEEGNALVGRWSLDSGKPLEPVSNIGALEPPIDPMKRDPGYVLAQYVILAALLGAVFVWRRNYAISYVPLGPEQSLAPLSRRVAAFLFDLSTLFVVCGAGIYLLWQREPGEPLDRQLLLGPHWLSPNGPVPWVLAGAVVGLYAAVFEGLSGMTPGKRLAGVLVVSHGGGPASLGQILIRNAARLVEFPLAPLVLLVALTPSNQRLGDMFARTVVIAMPKASGSGSPPASSPGDGSR